MQAGNTTQTMKPKEVTVTVCMDCGVPTKPGEGSARCPQCWDDRVGAESNPAPQSSDVNKPDIDEAAPILPEPVNEVFELPDIYPPINIWVLRNRIEKCEEQIDSLLNRLALFNIRSGQKI